MASKRRQDYNGFQTYSTYATCSLLSLQTLDQRMMEESDQIAEIQGEIAHKLLQYLERTERQRGYPIALTSGGGIGFTVSELLVQAGTGVAKTQRASFWDKFLKVIEQEPSAAATCIQQIHEQYLAKDGVKEGPTGTAAAERMFAKWKQTLKVDVNTPFPDWFKDHNAAYKSVADGMPDVARTATMQQLLLRLHRFAKDCIDHETFKLAIATEGIGRRTTIYGGPVTKEMYDLKGVVQPELRKKKD